MSQIKNREGMVQQSCFPSSLMLQLAWISNVAYPSFNGFQMIYHNDYEDPLTFPVVPPGVNIRGFRWNVSSNWMNWIEWTAMEEGADIHITLMIWCNFGDLLAFNVAPSSAHIWSSKEVCQWTKLRLFNSIIKPILFYSWETWRTHQKRTHLYECVFRWLTEFAVVDPTFFIFTLQILHLVHNSVWALLEGHGEQNSSCRCAWCCYWSL